MWDKAKDFLQRAFTIIFVATVLIWFLQSFDSRLNVVADSADSLLAMMGHWLAPIFAPLGFDDWRIPTALITGFSAKEAVVSTLGVLTGTSMETLGTALTGLFTPLSAISFLVFTLLYTPCMAAIAAVKRELGSGVLAGCVVVLQCVVAWAAAFLVYQQPLPVVLRRKAHGNFGLPHSCRNCSRHPCGSAAFEKESGLWRLRWRL